MAWIPRLVTLAGLVLLAHAGYSAQEHAALSSTASQQTVSSHFSGKAIPFDIYFETVAATLIVCLGLITGSPQLRPIRWRVWAGKIEREGAAGFLDGGGLIEKDYRGSPFVGLENRSGFIDIRKQRREFTSWTKANEN